MYKIFKYIFIICLISLIFSILACAENSNSDKIFGLVPTIESVITKKGKELHKLYEIYKFIPFYKNLEGKLIKTNSNIYKLTSFYFYFRFCIAKHL